MSHEKCQSCIDACYACATACDHCAASCLEEQDVAGMARCIKLDMDCAESCRLAASIWPGAANSLKRFVASVRIFAKDAQMNAPSTKWIIANAAPRLAGGVPKSASGSSTSSMRNGKVDNHDSVAFICGGR